MIDKDAIKELSKAEAISAASSSISSATGAQDDALVVALPDDMALHDLEKFMPHRRRARGSMITSMADDFSVYIAAHKEEGAAVFVDQRTMSATAVLNLGSPEAPGHADNTAVLGLKQTAAYKALLGVTSGPKTQTMVAEFMEDWANIIACEDDNLSDISVRAAIAAVRKITVEGMRRVESEEKSLSASRSLMEQVQVKNEVALPTRISFQCLPYHGLSLRTFVMRLSVITTDKPALQLRIVNPEQHDEEMAEELAAKVREVVGGELPVHIGSYRVAA